MLDAEEEINRVVAVSGIDIRCVSASFELLSTDAKVKPAREVDLCCIVGRSVMGERQSSSTTLGRPANAYDTVIAMSQLLPLSHRDTDIVLALHSFTTS